jgi:hypothetical protein
MLMVREVLRITVQREEIDDGRVPLRKNKKFASLCFPAVRCPCFREIASGARRPCFREALAETAV